MSIEDIKQIMDAFDPASLLPELSTLEGVAELICRIAVLAAPIVMLVLGLCYLLVPAKEANYRFGYRCYFGMGSIEAWRFTQRIAGALWTLLGVVLVLVMTAQTNGLRELEIMDQVMKAGNCILWELGLALFGTVALNITAAVFFDAKGRRRLRRKAN